MRRRVSARSWLRVVQLRSDMPTYLTPGVYVEEVPSANKPIEGVSTSIAAFVGLAPGGPVNTPMRISNWTQFAKIYGDPNEPDNGPFMEGAYLAHSVYGFFQNGGSLCWVVRVGDDGGSNGAGGPPARPPGGPRGGRGGPRPRAPRGRGAPGCGGPPTAASRPSPPWRSSPGATTSASRSPRSPRPARAPTRPTPCGCPRAPRRRSSPGSRSRRAAPTSPPRSTRSRS